MSLDYVFSSNPKLIELVQGQGYDLDSMIFLCKDIFCVCNDLNMESHIIGDFIKNLKTAYDYTKGKPITDEDNELPTRITVTNTLNRKVFYFSLLIGSNGDPYYACDFCNKTMRQGDVKSHVMDHDSS
ncbi:hypothetical protein SteCoe_18746 [Stentor coeruleus]|uniref:C2H2-type domain-containing protein n=1 Tax=Stentor coeruleus TaxID=5963 RepID=A0A1R2BVN6_9CILI|nr:hypothetical protein SteCoe_18746 [Stentor coeruleus]